MPYFFHRLIQFKWVFVVCIFFVWCIAALYIDAGVLLAVVYVVLVVAGFWVLKPWWWRSRLWLVVVYLSVCCTTVLLWWLNLSPSNDRQWRLDVAQLPNARIEGDKVTVNNVRHFHYSGEDTFVPRWETRNYDLSQLMGVDMFLSYWGPKHIAHTITSWWFADGSHLAISIETRKEKQESYSAVKGFFRQFEIYYVVADEQDLITLRAQFRGEQVYLYRLKLSAVEAKSLLLDYLREVNKLNYQPRWYNALTHNCTTAIRYHRKQIGAADAMDWRLLANGHLDQLGYERGILDQSMPFAALRKASLINPRVQSANAGEAFSKLIREGLPDPNSKI